MNPIVIWFIGLVILCVVLYLITRAWAKDDQQPVDTRPVCKFNDRDCYVINHLCPNGYCLVHCVCTCRGTHDHQGT